MGLHPWPTTKHDKIQNAEKLKKGGLKRRASKATCQEQSTPLCHSLGLFHERRERAQNQARLS